MLGELVIDYDRRRVMVAGHEVERTSTEHELLRILSVNAGRVMTHDALLRRVWGRREDAGVKAVRNFVKKLRPSSAASATACRSPARCSWLQRHGTASLRGG